MDDKNQRAISLYHQIQRLNAKGVKLAERAMSGDQSAQQALRDLRLEITPMIQEHEELLRALR